MENRRINFENIVNHTPEHAIADFGGCPQSGASAGVLSRLNNFLGYGEKDEFNEPMLEYYDIDTRGVGFILEPPYPNQKVIEAGKLVRDEWGVIRKFTGLYWDIVESPLKDKSYGEIKAFPFPDIDSLNPDCLKETKRTARELYENTDKIVVASHPVYGVFELACWMFGFDDFLYRMAAEPETVHMFFQRALNYQREISDFYYGEIGGYIHITTSGDDFATQDSTFCSVDMFNELIAPYLKERINFTKAKTKAKFLHHSCGNVFSLIPALIDCGVDILNPIQPCSALMKPESLTSVYGNKIVFHGGLDTQAILPKCSTQEIEQKTKELIFAMKGNSYVFAAAHNLQNDVPVENINAMFLAAKKYKNA